MTVPVFGDKIDNQSYQTRYGVYAIVPNPNQDQVILVQAPNGAWFLPGGEIENGENHHTALERELKEELGFKADLGNYLGQADDYFYSRHRDTHFYNPAFFYHVKSYQRVGNPLEDFNHLEWFPIKEAIERLKRGSHKWAVEQWLNQHQNLT
ncbi:NUDIX hydrolase [Streptococcus uberis]|uniref:NUDIX hydrolase n=1 Tax=Streptococcus uberis TaxID=1349 RepID=UPI000C2CE3F1|nr:NUDIX hydrolase [Streptococcus uberis]AUC25313.1 NUDIX hydrolase [Streptococcus uberis]MBI0906814.1 NUDIX hydrolase [Streptococcus uberis]MCK1158556.1 NUDIX hydrolase [Streptococcus uberis]MCK1194347.1 NUDIX hydrolase [Streptococcus uberis]MCK1198189.1 NUDIX hydrolase [Streptococcus uberis]